MNRIRHLEKEYGNNIVKKIFRLCQSILSDPAVAIAWLDDRMNYHDIFKVNISDNLINDYMDNEIILDPMGLSAIENNTSLHGYFHLYDFEENSKISYNTFLSKYGFYDEIDMYFCYSGKTSAIFSILSKTEIDIHNSRFNDLYKFIYEYLELHPIMKNKYRRNYLINNYDFTIRELDIAEMVRLGCSNEEISSLLDIRISTVKTHIVRTLDKLQVNSRTEMASVMNFL